MRRLIVSLLIAAGLMILGSACLAQEPVRGVGSWDEAMGSQRARVTVATTADAVWAHIPWRRPDARPEKRGIVVVESATGKTIENVSIVNVNNEYGDIVFRPASPGDYEIYYMLYANPTRKTDQKWLQEYSAAQMREADRTKIPEARVLQIQARTEFDRMDPMEVIATRKEVDDLLMRNPLKTVLLFPEDRKHPVRMADYLPQRWVTPPSPPLKGGGASSGPAGGEGNSGLKPGGGALAEFRGEAARGEYYTFQIGVYAARAAIDSGKDYGDVRVGFGDLVSTAGGVIPADFVACPSVGGYDRHGQPMARSFKVALGKVRPLWFGVQIPEDVPPGDYSGTMAIKVFGTPESVIKLTLTVTERILHDAGDSDLWRLSRLWWLDSRIAVDDETVSPYAPIKVSGSELGMLGRSIKFTRTGLPESIKAGGKEILARPIEMLVEESGGIGKIVGSGSPKNLKETSGRVAREYSGSSDVFAMKCLAITDLDGHSDFTVALKAKKDASLKDIRLEIPLKKGAMPYMMGLGRKGGYRPSEWKWIWDVNRANNSLWVGDVDAGLWLKLKGPHDVIAGADLRATGIPESWGNDGKGGCTVTQQADCALVRAFSGARTVKADEEITFRFSLMPTPLKPLDQSRWNRRYASDFTPVDQIKLSGANVVNVPCGAEPNPYTNYPFLATAKLVDYAQDAHRVGAKVNLGYNMGELSNHCAELWALRSLGDEVIADGPGGGEPWLQEHLIANYMPGTVRKLSDSATDAPLVIDGLSRWANYYLEGLAWLIENARVDGLYLDGVGFDREIMKRVRKVMDAAVGVQFGASNRPSDDKGYVPPEGKGEAATGETGARLIDLHADADPNDLGPRISPACRWMDIMPYVNSFRFDGMRPDEQHDYWLVEISGIPFGLAGDVPKGIANPWKGLLYGMATRAGSGNDPSPIWRLWDEFGIRDAKMTGYWSGDCPIKTGNENVLATVYSKKGKALIALVNWASEPARVKLTVDWKALGLDPRRSDLKAVDIPGVQEAKDLQWSGEIAIESGKGWLLVLQEK